LILPYFSLFLLLDATRSPEASKDIPANIAVPAKPTIAPVCGNKGGGAGVLDAGGGGAAGGWGRTGTGGATAEE